MQTSPAVEQIKWSESPWNRSGMVK